MRPCLVEPAHSAIRHRQRVVNGGRLRNTIEDEAVVLDRLGVAAFAQRDIAEAAPRHGRIDVHDALKLLAGVEQPIQAQEDLAKVYRCGVIARLQTTCRGKRLRRLLEAPGLLVERPEQMKPLAVARRESSGVHIGRLGGVEELVGVVDTGQRSVRVRGVSRRALLRDNLEHLALRVTNLIGDRTSRDRRARGSGTGSSGGCVSAIRGTHTSQHREDHGEPATIAP